VSIPSRSRCDPQEDSWYSFVRGWVDSRATERLEGLGKQVLPYMFSNIPSIFKSFVKFQFADILTTNF
jgi:hypothetical protein